MKLPFTLIKHLAVKSVLADQLICQKTPTLSSWSCLQVLVPLHVPSSIAPLCRSKAILDVLVDLNCQENMEQRSKTNLHQENRSLWGLLSWKICAPASSSSSGSVGAAYRRKQSQHLYIHNLITGTFIIPPASSSLV